MITENVRLLLNKLNSFCLGQLDAAAGLAMTRGHYEIGVEHFVAKCVDVKDSDITLIVQDLGVTSAEVKNKLQESLEEYRTGNTNRPVFSPRLLELMEQAWIIASVEFGHSAIRSGHLLAALATPACRRDFPWIDKGGLPITREKVAAALTAGINGQEERVSGEDDKDQIPGEGMEALKRFTINITEKAREGKIDPVFARDDEIRQMMNILTRRRKNNPILVGEPGTGKTAIVEGFALKVIEEKVPPLFKGVEILTLDLALLQAGASVKGEFENRLRTVIEAIKTYPGPVITFIDEAHTLIGAGGAAGMGDAANLLKPALARGELRTVAATTWTEYKKYIEKDPALARRFQVVKVGEPEDEGAFSILRGLKKIYEKHHAVRITDSGVVSAVKLSRRYLTGRLLPDKALDLLDTAAARVILSQNAAPPDIEELDQSLASLERERTALVEDRATGIPSDRIEVKIAEIDARVEVCRERLQDLTVKWQKEKDLVRSYLDASGAMIRAQEESSQEESSQEESSQEESSQEESSREEQERLAENVTRLAGELHAFQDGTPMVFSEVDESVVSSIIADWTGIPVGKMGEDEAEKLLRLEDRLSKRIVGQDHVITRIVDTLRVAKTGLKDPAQPMGVFLLTGPSGVGKTETGLGLAQEIFGGEQYVVTVNMSEYQEKHNVSKLIGSPPGYVGYGEGGVLTEAVRQKPYTVVLLDEVEKAHPDVMDIFYQVFDKGLLADGEGRIVDFSNTVIIVTSNLATTEIVRIADLNPEEMPSVKAILERIQPVLQEHFKPALLARMTILPFYPLGRETISTIVRKKLQTVGKRLKEKNVRLNYEEDLVEWIVSRCDLPDNGARNVESVINLRLLPKISVEMLSWAGTQDSMDVKELILRVEDGSINFEFIDEKS